MPEIRKERLCHHKLNWKFALPLGELLTVKKGHLETLGSEPFFQLLTNNHLSTPGLWNKLLVSKLPVEHMEKPFCLHKAEFMLLLPKWGGFFYFLLFFSTPLNAQERSAGTFQRGYLIFYCQASTKEMVPIATICKSFPQRAHIEQGACPFLHPLLLLNTMPGKPTPSSQAHKSPRWSLTVLLALKKEWMHMLEISILSHYQTFRKVPAALPKSSSGTHEKRLPATCELGSFLPNTPLTAERKATHT